MDENKGINISNTIMNTIKLLEERLDSIKQVNEEEYRQIRERLDNIYENSKNKQLDVLELLDTLMKLQNRVLQINNSLNYDNNTSLIIYNSHKKGLFRKNEKDTPIINEIAQIISMNQKNSSKSEYTENFKKPIYDFFRNIKEKKRYWNFRNEYILLSKQEKAHITDKNFDLYIYEDGDSTFGTKMQDIFPKVEMLKLLKFSELIHGDGDNVFKDNFLLMVKEADKQDGKIAKRIKFLKLSKQNGTFKKYKYLYNQSMKEYKSTQMKFFAQEDEIKQYNQDMKKRYRYNVSSPEIQASDIDNSNRIYDEKNEER